MPWLWPKKRDGRWPYPTNSCVDSPLLPRCICISTNRPGVSFLLLTPQPWPQSQSRILDETKLLLYLECCQCSQIRAEQNIVADQSKQASSWVKNSVFRMCFQNIEIIRGQRQWREWYTARGTEQCSLPYFSQNRCCTWLVLVKLKLDMFTPRGSVGHSCCIGDG